ncbi:MAG: hypothetical protein AB1894_04730 [Chloroflexota bacterium]
MGPGHFGVALAVKPLAPRAPLWALLVASEALDLLCFGFAAAGIETFGVTQADVAHGIRIVEPSSIPWSHGLFMSVVWSALAALLAYLLLRDRPASAAIGLVVFSHWVLDFVVHLPDLPLLFEGSPKVGLGLWSSGPGLILSGVLEVILLVGGITIYAIARKRGSLK